MTGKLKIKEKWNESFWRKGLTIMRDNACSHLVLKLLNLSKTIKLKEYKDWS